MKGARTPALRAMRRCCAHSYSERMSCAPRRITSSRRLRGVRVSCSAVHGQWFDEDAVVVDSAGRLVCQARQLALTPAT